jgi:hypothetical protein
MFTEYRFEVVPEYTGKNNIFVSKIIFVSRVLFHADFKNMYVVRTVLSYINGNHYKIDHSKLLFP